MMKNTNEYMKNHLFELGREIWRHDWSSNCPNYHHPVVFVEFFFPSLKKIRAYWTGFEPMTCSARIPMQCSPNWAFKPTGSWSHWELVIMLLYSEEYKWIYESLNIWTAEKDMKTWLTLGPQPFLNRPQCARSVLYFLPKRSLGLG